MPFLLFVFAFLSAGSLLHGADSFEALVGQLDSPLENIRGNAASVLLTHGEEGRDVLRARARKAEGPAALEAIAALRGDPQLVGDPELETAMAQWLEHAAPLLSPPFPDPASRLENGGFEEEGGWEFHREEGVEADLVFSDSVARSGSRSLHISRKNAAGTFYLRSGPVTVPAGQSVSARLFFHARQAPFLSTLRLRFEDEKGSVFAGDELHGHLRQSQTLLQNSPDGQWVKRVATLLAADGERRVRLRVYYDGNPGELWVDDVSFPSRPYSYQHSAPIRPVQTPLAGSRPPEKPMVATLARREGAEGRGGLLRNGRPLAPVMYHNMRSAFGDFAQMGERAGLGWQIVMLPFREYPSTLQKYPPGFQYWREDGSFDVEGAMEFIARAADRMPQTSALILGMGIVWPPLYGEKVERRWKTETGDYIAGTVGHVVATTKELPEGAHWWPSPFDQVSLDAALKGVRELVRASKDQPWFDRLAGCFVAGGHDGQFYTAAWPDYSEPATAAFRRWLKKKYGDEEALRAAWHRREATFAQAVIPPITATAQRAGMFFDPLTDQPIVDYLTCLGEQGMRIREAFAAAFKEEAGKRVVALAWDMGGGATPPAASVFLPSASLDGLAPQPYYDRRLPGLVGGIAAPFASYRLHGKLCIKELDLRTWFRAGGGEIDNQRISAAMTPQMFRNINRKEAGQMIAANQGFWYYDIGTTHFRDPDLLDEIGVAREVAEAVYPLKDDFHAQTALIHCEEAGLWEVPAAYHAAQPSLLNRFNYPAMKASGVPYDAYFLNDFMKLDPADLARYRLVVFGDAWRLTPQQREWIDERLKQEGRTLLWCYGAGHLSERGGEATGVTGIRHQMKRSSLLRAFASKGEATASRERLIGSANLVFSMYEGLIPFRNLPRFVIDDPEAEILARYEDGKAAGARRRFATWTSIYLAMPGGLDPDLIHQLAKEAGVVPVSDPGVIVEMNANFLSLHPLQAKPFEIRLPALKTVREVAKTEEIKTTGFILRAEPGETHWYRLSTPEPVP